MLTAAGIKASGPRGMVRAQALALMFGSVLRDLGRDDDPGLARTMAALDRALAAASASPACSTICALFPSRLCRLRLAPAPPREDDAEEAAA